MNADQQMDLDMAPTTIKELINDTIDSVICAELLEDDEVDLSLSEELETKLLGSVDEKEEEDEWESCEERENEQMEQEDKGEHGIGKAGAQANNAGQEEMEKDEIGSVDESVVPEEHGATAQIEIYENEAKGESETKGRIIGEVIVLDEEMIGATAQIKNMEGEKEKNEEKMEESEEAKENPEKSDMVSEGFANSGFDDIREALEVLEVPRHKDGKVREYWVSQIQKKGVVLVYPNPNEENNFPYLIFLDNETGEFERPLLPGDRVWVEEYEYISGKEYLNKERWIYAGLIQSQARATKVERVHLARQKDQEGLVVDLSRRGRAAEGSTGAVVVAAYGMVRAMALYERQLHPGIRMTDLKKAQPLKIQLADIPENWFVGPNYVLPNNTPVRTGMELQAGPNTKIPATAGQFARDWPRKNAAGLPIIFPLVPEYTQEEVAVAERIIAGALVVAAEHEETLKLVTQFKGAVEPQWDCWAPGGTGGAGRMARRPQLHTAAVLPIRDVLCSVLIF
uniref:Uncharacterized protein n=1 Tax=Globodera rostochiensis TaxID=31243 RepID=A0A914HYJ0_GLORO